MGTEFHATDAAAFLAEFESCRLPPAQFDHRAHLRAAYAYLSRHAFLEACIKMRDGIRGYAAHLGKAQLYHETTTIAFMTLVSSAMRNGTHTNWESLLLANPQLCDRAVLRRYYLEATLASPAARESFVMPDAVTTEPP